jgi:hypothetical protein
MAGRMAAEARMLDTFAVKRSLGIGYVDGAEVETFELIFNTVGRVKVGGGLATRESEAGGRTVVSVTRELHIPVTSAEVPPGAVAFCTAVDVTSDPTLLGAALHLDGPAPGSQTTARRLQVSEVIS